jgi:hypothetical protein
MPYGSLCLHGMSDHVDPFNGYLMLQDGAAPMQKVDKLTVRQVSAVSLKRARIAYLSTAENRAEWLVDEVIHIASGFQASDDRICVKVAKGFYERLKADCSLQKSDKAIAAALHDSVMEVRSTSRRMPLHWAPYIHLGA